jgi:hypothetical protein
MSHYTSTVPEEIKHIGNLIGKIVNRWHRSIRLNLSRSQLQES